MIADEIIQSLEDMIEKKLPISAEYYLEQAQRLAVLVGDENDTLHKMQKAIAQRKVEWIEKGKSVAEARLRVEAEDIYEFMQNQKAKVERINEIIRIAKIQARMRQSEYLSSNL